jgi:hypothetical protein
MESIIAALIGAILPLILGGKNSGQQQQQQQKVTTTTPPSGYQSPMLGFYDMLMGNLGMQNVKRTANMGYPAGQGLDTSWIDQMMQLIGPEWGKMLTAAKNPTPAVAPIVRYDPVTGQPIP